MDAMLRARQEALELKRTHIKAKIESSETDQLAYWIKMMAAPNDTVRDLATRHVEAIAKAQLAELDRLEAQDAAPDDAASVDAVSDNGRDIVVPSDATDEDELVAVAPMTDQPCSATKSSDTVNLTVGNGSDNHGDAHSSMNAINVEAAAPTVTRHHSVDVTSDSQADDELPAAKRPRVERTASDAE